MTPQHAGERMKLGSVFTGIGGFDKAAVDLGMEIAFQCEIDPFCLKVLAHRFPNVKRYTDVTKLHIGSGKPALALEGGARTEVAEPVDILVGGFP